MPTEYALGLSKLEMGDIAGDGGMGTVLEEVGNTVKGTAQLTEEDGTITDFFVEEQDDPILSVETQKGKTVLNFSCYDVSRDTLVKLYGGSIDTLTWKAPSTRPEKEQSLRLTSKRGQVMEIVRAKIVTKFNWSFTNDKLAQLDIQATILTPTKSNTPPFTVTFES
jgi:hypothetical protein